MIRYCPTCWAENAYEANVVFFVTHLYEFAHGFYDQRMANALFLRAERQAGGVRTFRLIESQPLPTSYGADLYRQVFGLQKERMN